MSDEEEYARYAEAIGGQVGLGDPVYDDLDADAAGDLGLQRQSIFGSNN